MSTAALHPTSSQQKPLAFLAFCGAAYFTIAAFASQFSASEMNFINDTLSQYALVENGWVLTLGFFAIGLTQCLLATVLWLDRQYYPVDGLVFLLLAGLGVILVAWFPVEPQNAPFSDRFPHILGAILQFACFPLALFRLGPSFESDNVRRVSRQTAWITACLFVLMLALYFIPTLRSLPGFGLIEKIDILIIDMWLLIMSAKFAHRVVRIEDVN